MEESEYLSASLPSLCSTAAISCYKGPKLVDMDTGALLRGIDVMHT